jgi:hypothetical protein
MTQKKQKPFRKRRFCSQSISTAYNQPRKGRSNGVLQPASEKVASVYGSNVTN